MLGITGARELIERNNSGQSMGYVVSWLIKSREPTMPRKPSDHEPTILRIEGLSGGEAHTAQPTQPTVEYDDFTGEPIVIAGVSAPSPEFTTPAPDHRLLARGEAQRERAEQLSMLVRLGLVDMPDPIPPEPPKPKPPHLAHNQRLLGDKLVITFHNPNALKRRM